MRMSKKKKEALYKAISDVVMNKRLNLMKPSNNKVYTPLAVDEILYQMEIQTWKAVCKALEIEENS